MPRDKCKNCHLFHQRGRLCPDLKTEIQVRIALDEVKAFSGGNPAKAQQNRDILQNLLKAKRQSQAGEAAGPPIQISQQAQPLPSHMASQPTQQPQQARLVAPQQSGEDLSGSNESTSEEESESESEEEESGSNVGLEQEGGD